MIDDNVDCESHLVAEVATKRTNSFPRLRERITLKNSSESGEDFACISTIFCVCENQSHLEHHLCKLIGFSTVVYITRHSCGQGPKQHYRIAIIYGLSSLNEYVTLKNVFIRLHHEKTKDNSLLFPFS